MDNDNSDPEQDTNDTALPKETSAKETSTEETTGSSIDGVESDGCGGNLPAGNGANSVTVKSHVFFVATILITILSLI